MATLKENMIAVNELVTSIKAQAEGGNLADVGLSLGRLQLAGSLEAIANEHNPIFELFDSVGAQPDFTIEPQTPRAVHYDNIVYTNDDPDNAAEAIFDKSLEYTDTTTFGYTAGYKLGASATFGINIGVASASVSVHSELNYSEQSVTTATQALYSGSKITVPLPPCSKRRLEVFLLEAPFRGTYNAQFELAASKSLEQRLKSLATRDMPTNLAEMFPGYSLVLEQTGTVVGRAGLNWDSKITPVAYRSLVAS